MDVVDSKPQDKKLGFALADFNVCQSCRIVDKDQERSRVGYECPVCKKPSKGSMWYFRLTSYSLINLMQEAFHAESELHEDREGDRTDAHDISVLLFFCALREVVLNHLVNDLCIAQDLSLDVRDRLLADNRTYTQKLKKLLPSLVGSKWNELVEKVNSLVEFDCLELNDFLKKASRARNTFMHEGRKWGGAMAKMEKW